MIKTKYKVFSVFLSALVLLSCFAFPASAADDESINVAYTTAISGGYYADASGIMQSLARGSFSSASSGTYSYNVTYTDDVQSACEGTSGESNSNGWIGYWFKVTPNTDLTAYNLADYNLSVYWSVRSDFASSTNPIPSDIYEVDVNNFIASGGYIGITSSERETVRLPRIGALHTFDTVDIVRDDVNYMLSQSLVITDTDSVTALTNKGKSVNVMLPVYAQADSRMFQYTFRLILTPKTTQTTDGYDLGTPEKYTFSIPITYGIENEMLNPAITDVYGTYTNAVRTGYRFRDYSKYYTHYSLPFMRENYAMWSVLARKSGLSDTSAWQNSLLDQLRLGVPYTLTLPDNFDINAQKVEFLFRIRIAGADAQLNWFTTNELASDIRSKFYDFEPYALQVGGLTIGYNYFTTVYYDAQKTVELTCRLSSEDETQKMFIKALLENTSFNLTFSVDPNMHGAYVALPYAGFFLGDAVPSPGNPDTPAGGFSQSDIDAAFNRGYNSGLSDGSDKNYVFGFVNGTWSAFSDFYQTVTNGISIGGIRLSAIITSVCIVAILVVVLKKVL